MTVKLATKTLALIDANIDKDGGAAFRVGLKTLLPKMDDAYRGEEDPLRSHLGASLIGQECPRALSYSFKWCGIPKFNAKTLRLFNRGHLEEARFISLLQITGMKVWYETEQGGQYRLSDFGGHFGSALDAIVRDCPDIPARAPAYGEFKTHKSSSFKKLEKEGVKSSKFQHFIQMQMCMKAYDLPYGLYMAVNKDTDELYAEIIEMDNMQADRYRERASNIIFTDKLLPKISNDPTWYECGWCDSKGLCHGNDLPRINCRTCISSAAKEDGSWACMQNKETINDKALSKRGCGEHVFNPHLINSVEILDADLLENWVTVRTPSGIEETWSPKILSSMQLVMRGLE